MSKTFCQSVTLLALLLLLTGAVKAQTVEQSVIAGGGGTSSDTNNTFSVTGAIGQSIAGVSSNSPFTVKSGFFTATPLGPTAAQVSIGGRVMTATGRGVRNVLIMMTDSSGSIRMTTTTEFGYYSFTGVRVGETYILSASGKRFTFSQPVQALNINEGTTEINFIANSEKRIRSF